MQIVFNWHLTERCNFACKYCFAKWNATNEIWHDSNLVEVILTELALAQTLPTFEETRYNEKRTKIRINFVGGEPLLLGNRLKRIIELATTKYDFAVSIVTNASLLDRHIEITHHLETLGLSIDSFSSSTNNQIGRCSLTGKTFTKEDMLKVILRAREINPSINIKTNTVVSRFNWTERPIEAIRTFKPDKIKVFRQLPFEGAEGITDKMFNTFLDRNKLQSEAFIEDNIDMTESYLMIDPMGRFFQNGQNSSYTYSPPIQKVGLHEALNSINFNIHKYAKRYEGKYDA